MGRLAESFFVYESELPPGTGFAHFSCAHWAWLIGIALTVLLVCGWYARQGDVMRSRVGKGLALSLAGMEVCQDIFLIFRGCFWPGQLPLHLCSMGTALCLFHAFWGWDWTAQVLYALSLPGTICALIFPDWNCYPQWSLMNLHSFLFHGVIVLYIACQLTAGRIQPRFRCIWKPILFLAVVVPPVWWFDRLFSVNYFFVCEPLPGTPLEWFDTTFGSSGYLPAYAVAAVMTMSLLLLPWSLQRRESK